MAALEGLDSVDWEGLLHAHGSAADVPQLIRGLLSPDVAERKTATEGLFATIWHQGSVYPATVHALPFLIELLSSRATDDQESLALLVASIMDGKGGAAEAKTVAEVRRIGACRRRPPSLPDAPSPGVSRRRGSRARSSEAVGKSHPSGARACLVERAG